MTGLNLTVKQKIREVWKHGGPKDDPDRLKDWLASYFPEEEYKVETVARRARELREAEAQGIF